jgi:hypothetical protein
MTDKEFVTEYGRERRVYDTNYMISGRLDTFYTNFVNNGIIQKYIEDWLKNKSSMNLETVWAQVAGDDATSVQSYILAIVMNKQWESMLKILIMRF